MKDKWIKTADQLPKPGVPVLACWKGQYVIAVRDTDVNASGDHEWLDERTCEVIRTPEYWQPLEGPEAA